MSDLKKLVSELSQREMTRKQFLLLVGGSLVGMLGIFRFFQAINMPGAESLATSDRGVFGEREYGHIPKKVKHFDEDVFG